MPQQTNLMNNLSSAQNKRKKSKITTEKHVDQLTDFLMNQ